MAKETNVPVVIPAYEPDERLIVLLEGLAEKEIAPVIVVNDGSGTVFDDTFRDVKSIINENGVLLEHKTNQGKGAALKTAFKYALEHYKQAKGVVTADSDGQHSAECIDKIRKELSNNPDALVLGTRCFDGEDIPWKSRFGNLITIKVFKIATGITVSDTQTGLRGIPRGFMEQLLSAKENRFEFEMRMLIDSKDAWPIIEVPIQTIYDSKENHSTHFDTVKDSARIYRLLLMRFFKYILSSGSSCLIDLALFQLACSFFRTKIVAYVALSTFIARAVSSLYNYAINYKFVFKSKESVKTSAIKYYGLVIIIMCASAILTSLGVYLIPGIPEIIIKVIVDTVLFFASYFIQKNLIY